MNIAFYQVEFYDSSGCLDHSAVVRMHELPTLAQGRMIKILYQVETEDALAMDRSERGVERV